MATTWFNAKHFESKKLTKPVKIISTPVYGYVLPHAGTAYTANIIMHTLNIRNMNYKNIKRVIIFYYPADVVEDIEYNGKQYYHEYYVPWQSIKYILGTQNENPDLEFIGYNIANANNSSNPLPDLSKYNIGIDTWIIISADFSHFMPLQKAVTLENKCAMALQYQKWNWAGMAQGVDDVKTFKYVFGLLNKQYNTSNRISKKNNTKKILRWVGRTRSPGQQGVGYLTFLITDNFRVTKDNTTILPDGMFVTCYDIDMNTRECLGKWFSPAQKTMNQINRLERELIAEVLQLGATTSRLTGGLYLDIPIRNYTVTYLFKSSDKQFIRGWHGVQSSGAFYLPDVFLENTYETGKWIEPMNNMWPSASKSFNMVPTIQSLAAKAGLPNSEARYTLYDCYVKHVSLGTKIKKIDV